MTFSSVKIFVHFQQSQQISKFLEILKLLGLNFKGAQELIYYKTHNSEMGIHETDPVIYLFNMCIFEK